MHLLIIIITIFFNCYSWAIINCNEIFVGDDHKMAKENIKFERIKKLISTSIGKSGPLSIDNIQLKDLVDFKINHDAHNSINAVLFGIERSLLKYKSDESKLNNNNIYVEIKYGGKAFNLVNDTLIEAYSERMDFLNQEERTHLTETMLSDLEKSMIYSFQLTNKRNNSDVGLLVLEPFAYLNKEVMLLSWVWIDKKLNIEDRALIKNQMVSILKNISQSEIIAKVRLENYRSLNFFESMGFDIIGIYLK